MATAMATVRILEQSSKRSLDLASIKNGNLPTILLASGFDSPPV